MPYRPELDGLRAVAVVLVVAHHLHLAPGGYVGVDVFFTISGFLITAHLRTAALAGRISYRAFYLRRARRLLPALFLVLAASLTLAAILLTPTACRTAARTALAAVFSVANLRLLAATSYFAPDAAFNPFLHTWSLSLEEQFYLFYPPLYPYLPSPHLLLPPAILFAHFCARVYPSAAFYLLPPRLSEFLIGAVLAHLPDNPSLSCPNLLTLAGLSGILLPAALYDSSTLFPGLSAMLPCVATALIIYASSSSTLATRLLANRPVVALGNSSYSLYLVHWPVLVFFRLLPDHHAFVNLHRATALALMALITPALYHLVETPFRRPPSTNPKSTNLTPLCARDAIVLMFALFAVILPATYLSLPDPVCALSSLSTRPRDILHAVGAAFADLPSSASPLLRESEPDLLTLQLGSNDTSAPVALVIGDSHAGRLAAFADYLGTKYRVSFHIASYPGCSPLLGTNKRRLSVGVGQGSVTPRNLAHCTSLVDKWTRNVQGGNFTIVFLVSRWSTSVEEGEYFTRGPLAEYRLVADDRAARAMPTLNESRAVFEAALRRTVMKLVRSTGKVVLVAEPPDVGRGSYQCKRWLSEAGSSWHRSHAIQPGVCTGANRTLALQRLKYSSGVVRNLAAEVDGVEAVFPARYLCDNFQQDMHHCRVVWGDKMLYRDSDHLSDFGALYLAMRWESDRRAFFPKGWKFT